MQTFDRDNGNLTYKLVRDGNWQALETLVQTFGGQGTCNVNSWAPDSTRFAYVSYPIRQRS